MAEFALDPAFVATALECRTKKGRKCGLRCFDPDQAFAEGNHVGVVVPAS